MTRILLRIFLLLGIFTAANAVAEDIDEVINSLSDADRKVIIDLKQEFASWPKKVTEEVQAYRDFETMLREQAKEKYDALSPDAKGALKKDAELTAKLSPSAMEALKKISSQYQAKKG